MNLEQAIRREAAAVDKAKRAIHKKRRVGRNENRIKRALAMLDVLQYVRQAKAGRPELA